MNSKIVISLDSFSKQIYRICGIFSTDISLEDGHANRTTNLMFVPHQLRRVKMRA